MSDRSAILVELGGADPVHIAGVPADLRVVLVDWDEIREGVYSPVELREMADEIEDVSPATAAALREYADG